MDFQNYGLYPQMSVFDGMAFGLRRRHLPKAEIDRRVRASTAILDIGDLLRRRPKQLSVGIRPEHLELASLAVTAPDQGRHLQGVVEVVEPLGAKQHILFEANGEKLTAGIERDRSIRAEQKVAFAIDANLVHFVDHQSGVALQ